jgi:hypothetical protein
MSNYVDTCRSQTSMATPEPPTLFYHSKLITPFKRDRYSVYGAAYDQDMAVVTASLRDSSSARYRHRDPVYLMPEEWRKAEDAEGKWLYLGHCFRHYGHHLLETLPMLAFLLEPAHSDYLGLFLPWGDGGSLLHNYAQLLGVSSRVCVYAKQIPLRGSFSVPARPIRINGFLKNRIPYRTVIDALRLRCLKEHMPRAPATRVFLKRKVDRVSPDVARAVEGYMLGRGFSIVVPESLSLAGQIALMTQVHCVVGFSGSQLHNSIFMTPGAVVVEIGDRRTPEASPTNQVICAAISENRLRHAQYSDDAGSVVHGLEKILESVGAVNGGSN